MEHPCPEQGAGRKMVSVFTSQRVCILVKLHFSIYDCDKGEKSVYRKP